jgi:hypothetical protein
MSLLCYECGIDLQPSKELPGREGMLVYPSLLSFIYLPSKDEKQEHTIGYVLSQSNRSICFECIEKGMPKAKKQVMKEIYDCYDAETVYRQIEDSQKGGFIRSSDNSSYAALMEYKKKKDTIPSGCIYCGSDVKNGLPYFNAVVLDRIESCKHKSMYGSYSWSNLEKGWTQFNICFQHFRDNFPKSFADLSCELQNKVNPDFKPMHDLYISPEFEEAMQKEGKGIDSLIEEMKDKKIDVRIIKKSR